MVREVENWPAIVDWTLHVVAYISNLQKGGMIKQFCHPYRDDGKQCLDIDERREAAMLKIQPRCSVCGRMLVQ